MTSNGLFHLRRIVSNHIDSSHIPDDQERHVPPTPSLPSSPAEERDFEAQPHDVEKNLRKKSSSNDYSSPETRHWPDDIVTFDSKTDLENPKNVSVSPFTYINSTTLTLTPKWSFRKKAVVTMLLGMTTMCKTAYSGTLFSRKLTRFTRLYLR